MQRGSQLKSYPPLVCRATLSGSQEAGAVATQTVEPIHGGNGKQEGRTTGGGASKLVPGWCGAGAASGARSSSPPEQERGRPCARKLYNEALFLLSVPGRVRHTV